MGMTILIAGVTAIFAVIIMGLTMLVTRDSKDNSVEEGSPSMEDLVFLPRADRKAATRTPGGEKRAA